MRKVLFVFVAAALAVPAFAAPDNSSAPAQPQKPKKEKKICKRMPAPTGSWMPQTVCKTAAEWQLPENDDAQKIGYDHHD